VVRKLTNNIDSKRAASMIRPLEQPVAALVVGQMTIKGASLITRLLEQPVVVVRKLTNNIDSKRAASMMRVLEQPVAAPVAGRVTFKGAA
ncbi:MAG: hypothetical protein MPK08_04455, partial [Alphaproteobacteria bacterium]|nr:hypothetical protein [Alphaproteobacteria bacterium]